MSKILGFDADNVGESLGGFGYTSIALDKLGASEYTVVSIVVDKTTSVAPFKDLLEDMVQQSLEACKQSPRALNLLARTTAFSAGWDTGIDIEELHGFTLLNSIDLTQFRGTIEPRGSTPLYEAVYEALDTTYDYAKTLYDQEYICNAIMFIITDGEDNASSKRPSDIKELKEKIRRKEHLESVNIVLIGVNDTEDDLKQYLEDFKRDADLDQYESAGKATKNSLAKVAGFISQSVSATSNQVGSGAPSQPLPLTI